MNLSTNKNKNKNIFSFLKNYKFNKIENSIKVLQFCDKIISYINDKLIDINEQVLKPQKNENGKYFKTRVELKKIIFYVLYLFKQTQNYELLRIINFIIYGLYYYDVSVININNKNENEKENKRKLNYSIIEYIYDIEQLFNTNKLFNTQTTKIPNILNCFNKPVKFYKKIIRPVKNIKNKNKIINNKNKIIYNSTLNDIIKIINNNKNNTKKIIQHHAGKILTEYKRPSYYIINNILIEYNDINIYIKNIITELAKITDNLNIILFIYSKLHQDYGYDKYRELLLTKLREENNNLNIKSVFVNLIFNIYKNNDDTLIFSIILNYVLCNNITYNIFCSLKQILTYTFDINDTVSVSANDTYEIFIFDDNPSWKEKLKSLDSLSSSKTN